MTGRIGNVPAVRPANGIGRGEDGASRAERRQPGRAEPTAPGSGDSVTISAAALRAPAGERESASEHDERGAPAEQGAAMATGLAEDGGSPEGALRLLDSIVGRLRGAPGGAAPSHDFVDPARVRALLQG